jgi:hypothetical protein
VAIFPQCLAHRGGAAGRAVSAAILAAWYVTTTGAAALIAFAESPTSIMFWQVFVALPACALAMVIG